MSVVLTDLADHRCIRRFCCYFWHSIVAE